MAKEIENRFKEIKGNVVTLVACHNLYRDVPFFAHPVYNNELRGYDLCGQEKLTEIQKKNEPFILDPLESIALTHNMKFYKGIPHDELMYKFVQSLIAVGIVAEDVRKVQKGKHIFYLDDKEVLSLAITDKADKTMKALNLLSDKVTLDDLKGYALLLKMNIKGLTENQIKAGLQQKALDNPADVIEAIEGNNDDKLFILQLLDKGILIRKQGRIYDDQILIGRDLDEAMMYKKDVVNQQLVDAWSRKLNPKG